jgi:hypothetical protein
MLPWFIYQRFPSPASVSRPGNASACQRLHPQTDFLLNDIQNTAECLFRFSKFQVSALCHDFPFSGFCLDFPLSAFQVSSFSVSLAREVVPITSPGSISAFTK